MPQKRWLATAIYACVVAACAPVGVARSQERITTSEPVRDTAPTYADLVDLALSGELAAVIQIDKQITVPAERAPGVLPGQVRLYIEASTQRLLASPAAIGESLTFLIDRPLRPDGRAPDLKKRAFIVFGDRVPGYPGSLQLSSSAALLPAGAEIEARVRRILSQIAAADSLARITGLRDIISVRGNLAGESETQMFVETAGGAPVSLSVIRRPGMAPRWGVSLGEIVDQDARPPEPETIAWYRFACELPDSLPEASFLQSDRESRDRARADYVFLKRELGPCERRMN